MRFSQLRFISLGLLAACSSGGSNDAGGTQDASAHDAADAVAADVSIDKAGPCVSTFGQAIGSVGFARFDGTVVAVVPPNDQSCTAPNSTHLVLELSFAGAVYRMVVDVNDLDAPGTIRTHTLSHAMIGGAWKDGWHSVPLDYAATLGLKSSEFASTSTADAVASITRSLDLGAHVSVFATAQGEADSAHLVHRNLANQDGAIVVDVDGAAPTWLLFAFSNQTF